jgi:hypothetical protein
VALLCTAPGQRPHGMVKPVRSLLRKAFPMKKPKWIGLRPKDPANRARAFCRTTKRWLAEMEGIRNALTPDATVYTGRAAHRHLASEASCGAVGAFTGKRPKYLGQSRNAQHRGLRRDK